MALVLVIAFISGLLTIFAPCIWPLLPVVISTSSTGGKLKPLGLTLGILFSFAFFTLTLSYLVRLFQIDPGVLRLVAVIVLLVLGVSMLVPRISMYLETSLSYLGAGLSRKLLPSGQGFWGGLITGISLGIVWTPCAGPILATIAALAVTQKLSLATIFITIFYVIGTGIPLLLFASASQLVAPEI